jgi:hypothetical protein
MTIRPPRSGVMNRDENGNLDLLAANLHQRDLLQGAIMPAGERFTSAVCPRPEAMDDPRAPRFFATENEAREFLNAEVAFFAHTGKS